MTEVVSFRPTDEMEEEIQRERDLADSDLSRSLAAKRLAGEAVEARNTPFWYRRDMSRRHRAQIENERDDAEDDDDVVEKLLIKAVKAEQEDVLDTIGASDELRDAVEAEREEGESLDGAVERLLRLGVDADTGPPSIWRRLGVAGAFVGSGGLFLVLYQTAGPLGVVFVALALIVYLAAYPQIEAATDALLSRFAR